VGIVDCVVGSAASLGPPFLNMNDYFNS
jgi:hypothetical protein